MDPAVRPLRLGGRRWVLVIAVEGARAAEQYFPALRNTNIAVLDRRTDRVGFYQPVLLNTQKDGALGHPVKLLQVDPERSVEDEEVRSDRLACGIGDTDAAQPDRVLERTVNQHIAEPMEHPIETRHRLPVEDRQPDAFRNPQEIMEDLALGPAGIFHPDHDLGQNILEDPRRREEIGRPEL